MQSEAGGAEKVLFSLLKELAKRGHTITVFTLDLVKRGKKEEIIEGVHIRKYSPGILDTSPVFLLHMMKNDCDLVYTQHCYHFTAIAAAVYARIKQKPLIVKPIGAHHCPSFLPRLLRPLLKVMVLFNLKTATAILPTTVFESNYIKTLGISGNKIKIMRPGIPLGSFSNLPDKNQSRKRFGIPDNANVILYVGRIEYMKGIDVLLYAFREIVKIFKNTYLLLVGPFDSSYVTFLLREAGLTGISKNIILTGFLHGEHLLSAYSASDVFVLPSRFELSPLTIIEASACSLPVVTTSVGGCPELVINGYNGITVLPNDENSLTKAIHKLLYDDDLRSMMGKNGKMLSKKFPIEKYIEEKIRLFENVAY